MMYIVLSLIGGLAVLYALYTEKTKHIAISLAAGFALTMIILSSMGDKEKQAGQIKFTYSALLSEKTRAAMEARDLREHRATPCLIISTPLEKGGVMMLVSLWFILLMAPAILEKFETKNGEDKEVYVKAIKLLKIKLLSLAALITMYFLSLYCGMELIVIPWIKCRQFLLKPKIAE